MTAPELKPCPFCGGPADIHHHESYSTDSSFDYVGCSGCWNVLSDIEPTWDARSQRWKHSARDLAIAAWNTRADLHRAEVEAAVVRALEAAVEKAVRRWEIRREHADKIAEMDYAEAHIDAKTVSAKADEAEMIAAEIRALATDPAALERIIDGDSK